MGYLGYFFVNDGRRIFQHFVVDVAGSQFFSDFAFVEFAGIVFQNQGVIPLKNGFVFASAEPIGIAKMVADERIGRFKFGRYFQIINRFVVLSETLESPAKTVGNMSVVGNLVVGIDNHPKSFVDVFTVFQQTVAQKIEHEVMVLA